MYYFDFSFDLLTTFERAYQNFIVDSNVKKINIPIFQWYECTILGHIVYIV